MQGKFALFFAIFCFGISNFFAQETVEWKTPPQIRSSEFFFDFKRKGQFEVKKDILFSDRGIKIAGSKQTATLISKKTARSDSQVSVSSFGFRVFVYRSSNGSYYFYV